MRAHFFLVLFRISSKASCLKKKLVAMLWEHSLIDGSVYGFDAVRSCNDGLKKARAVPNLI